MRHPFPRFPAALVCAALAIACGAAFAAPTYVEVPMNGTRQADTVAGFGLPSFFGPASDYYAVFKLGPFAPGKRFETTLTYDAGTDIGYAMAWVDGDPSGKDFASFVGIGTGTGTREMKGKESKFLFTVDAKSTAAFLYLVLRSSKPWDITMALADRLSGAEPGLPGQVGLLLRDRFRRRSDVAVPAHPGSSEVVPPPRRATSPPRFTTHVRPQRTGPSGAPQKASSSRPYAFPRPFPGEHFYAF